MVNTLASLVSVIVPTVELTTFVRAAVASALNDGYPMIEVIVVVDGPMTDAARTAWAGDSRVHTVATGRRQGTAAAINLGVEHASGEYVARLDSDDLSFPGRFTAQLEFMRRNPDVVLVGTEGRLIDQNGRRVGRYPAVAVADVRRQLARSNPVIHSSFFVSREVLERAGGYNPTCIRMQDYELLLRLALVGRIAIIGGEYVGYRIHDAQSSKNLSGFLPLMALILKRRMAVAKVTRRSSLAQSSHNLMFCVAQLLRYMKVRPPRYLRGVGKSSTGTADQGVGANH